jgi:hypothetical protein
MLVFVVEGNVSMVSSNLISLREAANSIPSRPHINSVRRWILKGARGKKLDAKQVGGRWFTTHEAVQEFVDAPANVISPGRQLSASQREASEQARKIL